MAEYIERETLIAEIEENIKTYWDEGSGGYWLAEDAINESVKTVPTADVVPKSEVEAMQRLYGEKLEVAEALIAALNKTKSEVAREIFEEIERIFGKHMLWYRFTEEQYQNYEKLKKKYTGETE